VDVVGSYGVTLQCSHFSDSTRSSKEPVSKMPCMSTGPILKVALYCVFCQFCIGWR